MNWQKTSEYRIWIQMRARCNNPKHKAYKNYGNRGIKVCDRWNDFFAFLEDMGARPHGWTLERTDNHGDYEPSNCKWVERKVNNRNRRNTATLTVNGVTKTLGEWAEATGLNYNRIYFRYRKGMTPEQIITQDKLPNHTPGKKRGPYQKASLHATVETLWQV